MSLLHFFKNLWHRLRHMRHTESIQLYSTVLTLKLARAGFLYHSYCTQNFFGNCCIRTVRKKICKLIEKFLTFLENVGIHWHDCFERIMADWLTEYLETNNLINLEQHGSRRGKSVISTGILNVFSPWLTPLTGVTRKNFNFMDQKLCMD